MKKALACMAALVFVLAVWGASEFMESYGPYPPGDYQYVMVDQHGNIYPTNSVATVADAAATAARVAASEVAAQAYTEAEARTAEAVDDLARAAVSGQLVVYEDDFVYSLGTAVAVSTNCQCRIYEWRAQTETVMVEGVECWRNLVYFGFTENVSALTPVAQFLSTLGGELDWGPAVCGEAEPQNHTFVVGADSFDFCYKMTVDIPKAYYSAFVRIFTEVSVQIGDGSVLDIVGGLAGGRTETVSWGEATIEYVGGLAVESAAEEIEEP